MLKTINRNQHSSKIKDIIDIPVHIYKQYKAVILYILFGGLTTVTNIVTYYICTRWFYIPLYISTITAWFFSVLFSYATNRKYVFLSKNQSKKALFLEFVSFILCRLFTGAMDIGNMYGFVHLLKLDDFMIKVASNLEIILVNYIASKLFIFKKHDTHSLDHADCM